VNVAAFLAQKREQKVLLVDLDTQGHAAKSLGIYARTISPTVFDLLTNPEVSLEQVARPTAVPNLSVVPAWKDMAEFPTAAASDPNRAHRLSKKLAEAEGRYDLVIFDAPPSMGLVTTNILLAASEVVIPVATTYLALDGCAELVDTVKQVSEGFSHPGLAVTLVVPTLYRKTALADEIVERLRSYFPGRTTDPISFNVAIDEAQSHGKTIWEYAPWSRGATMLQGVAEAVERGG